MADSPRDMNIKVLPDIRFGQFANAFRVVEEVGQHCFLDFLVYSATENEATVIARVRVQRDFLPAICEKMQEAFVQFGQNTALNSENFVFREDGKTVH